MSGTLIAQIVIALLIIHMILGLISYLILLERRTAAWIQDRQGPNRVGPFGLLQPIADGVKFILKEEFIPANADKFLFLLAPIAIIAPAMCGFAVIPWGGVLAKGTALPAWLPLVGGWQFPTEFPVMVANPSIGVLFVIAMASLSVYGVVLAGYASGSKFSFLGGLRATAQMLSYEIPMALALMAVVVMVGSLNLGDIASSQAHYWFGVVPAWNLFRHPIAFVIFVTSIFAECNRTPFDLAECETELVGGYHTEYSSMTFALFFLAEYASMITGSAVAVTLFLGGWHLPWLDKVIYGAAGMPEVTGWGGAMLKFAVLWGKVIAFLFFYMWVRWTLPRFRFDQLMTLAWRGMIPLSLGAFLISGSVLGAFQAGLISNTAPWLILGNLAFLAVTLLVIAKTPAKAINRRIMVPNSRYNPQLRSPQNV